MYKTIGYHTRLSGNNAVKVSGGSFGGDIDWDTVNRLISSSFTVAIKPSGRAVFVDKQGREVRLYLSVDAECSEAGKAAIKKHAEEKRINEEQRRINAEREDCELSEVMAGLTHGEIIRRLRGSN